nr:dna-directed rna polymerase i subunit rpa12 [Quercus suber]
MAAIGSLVFCTDCGNLLDRSTGGRSYITCDVCGAQNKDVQEVSEEDRQTDAVIRETCEKCGCEEVRYREWPWFSASEQCAPRFTVRTYRCPMESQLETESALRA